MAAIRFNKAEGKAEIVDVVRYPAECVNPPEDMTSTAWLEAGMPGANATKRAASQPERPAAGQAVRPT